MDYLDGVEALYQLLDGLQVSTPDGQPFTLDGVVVPRAVTVLELPADTSTQVREQLAVLLLIDRAGWSDDQKRTEGHERVSVDVYGATADLVRTISRAIEVFLVDKFHEVPGVGFIDDVLIDNRWRIVREAHDDYARSTATYRLVSRPD